MSKQYCPYGGWIAQASLTAVRRTWNNQSLSKTNDEPTVKEGVGWTATR
jgi:hypothetical protein